MSQIIIPTKWRRVLIILTIFGGLVVLFWRELFFTILYVYFSLTVPLIEYQSYLLQPQTPVVVLKITHGELSFSIPFAITESNTGDFYGSYHGDNSQHILLFKDSPPKMTTEFKSFSSELNDSPCNIFERGLGKNICASEYQFTEAIVNLTHSPVTLISGKESKLTYTILTGLQKTLVPLSSVLVYNANDTRGFIFEDENNSDTVILYDERDRAHTLTLSGLSTEERDYLLSTVQLVKSSN